MEKAQKIRAYRRRRYFLGAIFLLSAFVLFLFYAYSPSTAANSPGNFKLQEKNLRNPKTGCQRIDGKKVAVAITVTKDGPYMDGAAVLVQSVLNTNSDLDMDFVAIVHPGVVTTRQALRDAGFKIVEFDPPVVSSDIQGKHLRDTIDKSGCCGALELLKLRAYELTEYHRVLLLDMDSMLLRNIDHLFREDPKISLQFTWDHAMNGGGSAAPPVQGGFLLLRPSKAVFNELRDIVIEGDFRPGTGWKGTKIGWCWGGQTVQGLLAYYYSLVNLNGKALDDCIYNNMDSVQNRCDHVPNEDVKTAHFTVCQKPWECHRGRQGLCEYLHTFWWNVRQDLEQSQGYNPTGQCCRGCSVKSYSPLPPFSSPIAENKCD